MSARPGHPVAPTGSPPAALLRWGGFAGAVLLAAGSWLAGAWVDPAGQAWRIPGIVLWFAGLAALTAAWWPLATALAPAAPADGDHRPAASDPPRDQSPAAGDPPRDDQRPTTEGGRSPGEPGPQRDDRWSQRWLAVTGALWAVPLLLAPVTASRDVYSYACQGASWLDGGDPYAVGGTCGWAEAVASDWRDAPAPYGGTALLLSGLVVALARLLPLDEHGTLVAAVTLFRLCAVAAGVLTAWSMSRLARRLSPGSAVRRPALALGLLTPLAAIHLVGGAHHDALIAALVLAALAVSARTHPADAETAPRSADGARWVAVVAGGLAGLAVAVKVTAVVALPFVAVLAAGPRRRLGRAVLAVAAAVTAFGLVSAPFGLGWTAALTHTGSMVQWTSVPTAAGMAVGYLLRAAGSPEGYAVAVAVARAAGILLLAATGLVLLWRAVRRYADPGAVVRCAGWTLAAVAVLSPVFYPWYALPALAVLAVTGTRVAAQAAVTAGLAVLVLPDGLGLAVRTKLPGAFLVVIAVCLLAWRAAGSRRRRAASAARRGGPATPRSTG